jgi:hypothetical protein
MKMTKTPGLTEASDITGKFNHETIIQLQNKIQPSTEIRGTLPMYSNEG